MINPSFVEYLMGYPQGYTAGAVMIDGTMIGEWSDAES